MSPPRSSCGTVHGQDQGACLRCLRHLGRLADIERPRDRSEPLTSGYLDRLAGLCRCMTQPIPARNGGSQGGASSLLEELKVPGSMKGLTLVQPGLACCGIGVQFPVEYACFPSDPAGDARPRRFPIELAAPGPQAATGFSRFAVGNRPGTDGGGS